MQRMRWIYAAALLVALVGAGLVSGLPEARAAPKGVLLSEPVPGTRIRNDQTGIVFRTVQYAISYKPPRKGSKTLSLASRIDGSGDIFTDDVMAIRVEPENSQPRGL